MNNVLITIVKRYLITLYILVLPLPLLAGNCTGVWNITQRSATPIELDKSGFARIQFELKKVRYQNGQCALESVRLKLLNYQKANGLYFVNQNETMMAYDPKEREYLLLANRNRPIYFSLIDPTAKLSYAEKYSVPFLVKLQLDESQTSTLSTNAHYIVKSFVTLDWSGRGDRLHQIGSGYSWQLGVLDKDKRYQTDFLIRSNSRTELWVKPKYGQLINTQDSKWAIDYKLIVDGNEITTTNRMMSVKRYVRGQHIIPFDLRIIGNTNLSRAGHYKEELQIQVKAIKPIF